MDCHRLFKDVLHTKTAGVIHKLRGCIGSQEDVGWLFNYEFKADRGLGVQELFDLLNNLDAVFIRHLVV
jgi:hypothetical protein